MILWICLLLLLLGGIAAFTLGDAGSMGGLSGDMLAGIAASLALLIFIGSALIGDYRGRMKGAVKDIAVWIGIAFILIAAYSFRNEGAVVFNRVASELMPPGQAISFPTTQESKHVVRIRQRSDDHFSVRARINNTAVGLLVDTGASTVVLKTADARAVGINTDTLTYSVPVNTANGATFAAAVRLSEIRIGPIIVRDIEALISKPGALKESLLGMNFLRRLRSYEFSGEFLTLRG